MQQGYYTSGEFAKKANVTIRTIRFYDKQGILKPSKVGENGYRLYTDEDFGRLQRILSLRYLGFSLDEIMAMPMGDDADDVAHSLAMQKNLIEKRIHHLETMSRSLEDTARMVEQAREVDWSRILQLIHITNMEHAIVEQYKSAVNINVRIGLHSRFSHNPVTWFQWLGRQINFDRADDILEVGCGNGELWRNLAPDILKNHNIHVTDISEGMVEDAKGLLDGEHMSGLHFQTEDCQMLTFEDGVFDAVIANHVLFYLKDIPQALGEIRRVLRGGGIFYCSTYGREHMREITLLVQEFDPRISLSEVALYDLFGLENGQAMLEEVFGNVKKLLYDDYLLVDEAEPLLDYILSCHGNQGEYLNHRREEFRRFLQKKINDNGGIRITKRAGVFVCQV